MAKIVYCIDGSSFLYRAYYSMRPLHTPTGIPVQAVFGFCRMLKKLIDDVHPAYMALVWDSKGSSGRQDIYPAYKATRQSPPTDLFHQKKYITDFADLIGLTQVVREGIEADDLLYSLADDLAQHHAKVVLVTSDKDMAQALIFPSVTIYDPFKEMTIDANSFEAAMGFPVTKIAFYYALVGDATDNIPGVRGIGPKHAVHLVQQFKSLSHLYDALDSISNERLKKTLEEHKQDAYMSEQLFVLKKLDLGMTVQDFAFDAADWDKAQQLFKELNFKKLIKEAPTQAQPKTGQGQLSIFGNVISDAQDTDHEKSSHDFPSQSYRCVMINTVEELTNLVEQIRIAGACALDTETNGLNPMLDGCIGISVCVKVGIAYYIPIRHTTQEPQLTCEQLLTILGPVLADATIQKYMHNAKFDLHVFDQCGLAIHGLAFDSYIAARLLLKEWQRAGLKVLSEQLLHESMITYEQIEKLSGVKKFSAVPLAEATQYAAGDAHQTLKLVTLLQDELRKEPSISRLYYEIEHPLITILWQMEHEGIFLDCTILKNLGLKIEQALHTVEQTISTMTGLSDINLNSSRQIEELLFTRLGLPAQKKNTKSARYSTDHEVLTALAKIHVIPGLIVQYRELAKLKNTYVDTLPSYINPHTHHIHTSFSQVSTATGRLASSEPNLQNIPTDGSGFGITIRGAFKPDSNNLFISADYNQIELRILAVMTQDQHLLTAFKNNHDIHAETASRIFGTPRDQVTHEQRQIGKRINFSILYGLTPHGLAKDLGIKHADAKHYIEQYFEQYPAVAPWMEALIATVKQTGYVETLYGRRRYIPGIYETNHTLYAEARRVAINTKAQGSAADIMKLAMVNLAAAYIQEKLDAKIILQLHDELVITAPIHQVTEASDILKTILESVVAWEIPLSVTVRTGASWQAVTK